MILGTLTNRLNDSVNQLPRKPTVFGRRLAVFSVNAVILAITIQEVIRIQLLYAAEDVGHETRQASFKAKL